MNCPWTACAMSQGDCDRSQPPFNDPFAHRHKTACRYPSSRSQMICTGSQNLCLAALLQQTPAMKALLSVSCFMWQLKRHAEAGSLLSCLFHDQATAVILGCSIMHIGQQVLIALQVMIHEILTVWGQQGLEAHVKKMQTEYKERAAIVQKAAGKAFHGPSCCCPFVQIAAGFESCG